MPTVVFSLALALNQLCLASPATGIPVQPAFRYKKLEGEWHRQAMVIQGAEPAVVASKIRISPMGKGDLDVGRNTIVRLSCRYIEYRYKNAGQPGVFNIFQLGGEPFKVHVVATDYANYLVLHIQRGSDVALYLFGRGLEASEVAKQKFKHHMESLGFSGTVEYPQPDDKCSFPH